MMGWVGRWMLQCDGVGWMKRMLQCDGVGWVGRMCSVMG